MKAYYFIINESDLKDRDFGSPKVFNTDEEAREYATHKATEFPGHKYIIFKGLEYAVCDVEPAVFYTGDQLEIEEKVAAVPTPTRRARGANIDGYHGWTTATATIADAAAAFTRNAWVDEVVAAPQQIIDTDAVVRRQIEAMQNMVRDADVRNNQTPDQTAAQAVNRFATRGRTQPTPWWRENE